MIDNSETDIILKLEVAYCKLYQALMSNDRDQMINAFMSMNDLGQSFFINSIKPAIKNTFIANGKLFPCSTDIRNIIDINDLRLNIMGCMSAVQAEIGQRQFYASNYQYAQQVLYDRHNRAFTYNEILYVKQGEALKVADLLKVLRYSISIAEAIEPNNKDYEYASAVLTVLQGLDAMLNNKPEDKPMNKMLHLATSFISTIVKSSLSNEQVKREVTVSAMMLDLTIDFFCNK